MNGICILGCRASKDCPSEEACINNKCLNPCLAEAVCGPNAICRSSNHVTECRCPEGFVGNPLPQQGCVRVPISCNSPNQCPSGHHCVSGICALPCIDTNQCASGERCSNQLCVKVMNNF